MKKKKINMIIRKRMRKLGKRLREIESEIDEVVDLLDLYGDSAEDADKSEETFGAYPPDPCPDAEVIEVSVRHQPDLTHTRVRLAIVDGTLTTERRWNGVLEYMFRKAYPKIGGYRGIVACCTTINFSEDDDENHGFKFIEDLGLAYQNASVQCIWPAIHELALKLQIAAEVRFTWLRKKKARYPGREGVIIFGDAASSAREVRLKTPVIRTMWEAENPLLVIPTSDGFFRVRHNHLLEAFKREEPEKVSEYRRVGHIRRKEPTPWIMEMP